MTIGNLTAIYWRMKLFVNQWKQLLRLFSKMESSNAQTWEFFKFKIRELAIKHSTEIKKLGSIKEMEIIKELNILINKGTLTVDEELKLTYLKEVTTSCFFALEKINYKRNKITSLRINNST